MKIKNIAFIAAAFIVSGYCYAVPTVPASPTVETGDVCAAHCSSVFPCDKQINLMANTSCLDKRAGCVSKCNEKLKPDVISSP